MNGYSKILKPLKQGVFWLLLKSKINFGFLEDLMTISMVFNLQNF